MILYILLFSMFVTEPSLIEKEVPKDEKRIKITSNRAVQDMAKQKSILYENVKVVDGQLIINCQQMTIESKNKEADFVVAEKEVIIVKENFLATGDRAEYFLPEKKVILTGNATITQTDPKTKQKNVAKGLKIIFYRDKNVVEIEGFEGDVPGGKE